MSIASTETPKASRHIVSWILQILVAAAFLAAASAKLAGVTAMVQLFAQIGLGQWFRIVTAIVEITGALLLVYPRTIPLGALWLGGTMFFAVLTHLFVLHTNPAPAVVLGLMNAAILYLRRNDLVALVSTILRRN